MMHVSGGRKLARLRQIFLDTEEDALGLEEFVEVMMTFLPPTDDPVSVAADLIELFADIDINGDGDLEWEEFTGYCIEAAIAAIHASKTPAPDWQQISSL